MNTAIADSVSVVNIRPASSWESKPFWAGANLTAQSLWTVGDVGIGFTIRDGAYWLVVR